ncbi:MPN domain-containing protein-like isoform X2 [Lineus longissimus]|uniref:MPN domain-containing protein-like isoform X2 n=1 Tax=Lineus longissimus TaxID=88925 RepID=UPI00315CAA3B
MATEDISPYENSSEEDDGSSEEGDTAGSNRSTPAKLVAKHAITGRGITLCMLMQDGIVEAGVGLLTISYLGKKFVGDLLPDGKIKFQENGELFNSPSAWAIHCKKIVNPTKKSGCGWASVKYKGRKLDAYKTTWFRKQNPESFLNKVIQPPTSTRKPEGLSSKLEALNNANNLKNGNSSTQSQNGDSEKNVNGDVVKPQNGTKSPESVSEESKKSPKEEKEKTAEPGEVLDLSMSGPYSQPNATMRKSVKYTMLGRRELGRDTQTLVQCARFQDFGKLQPFTISFQTNSLLLMDYHCHLTTSEVVGYLAGKWDQNSQHLTIVQSFPCRCRLGDRESSVIVEEEIRQNMERRGLTLVGWYHSHPECQADPSIKDIESQFEYQLCLKGMGSSYHPCIGVICSSYNPSRTEKSSKIRAFWVMPPLELATIDYSIPMEMSYNEIQDTHLSPEIVNEMKWLTDFYRGAPDLIPFASPWQHTTTYLEKIKASLSKRLPNDQGDGSFLDSIHILLTQYM